MRLTKTLCVFISCPPSHLRSLLILLSAAIQHKLAVCCVFLSFSACFFVFKKSTYKWSLESARQFCCRDFGRMTRIQESWRGHWNWRPFPMEGMEEQNTDWWKWKIRMRTRGRSRGRRCDLTIPAEEGRDLPPGWKKKEDKLHYSLSAIGHCPFAHPLLNQHSFNIKMEYPLQCFLLLSL